MGDVFDWSSKQYALALLENLEIDLWLESQLGYEVFSKLQMTEGSDLAQLLESYQPEYYEWPNKLILGIQVDIHETNKGTTIPTVSETVESQLRLDNNEHNPAIYTYKLLDIQQTYNDFINAVISGREQMEVSSDHTRTSQSLAYAFISGFSPSLFLSSQGAIANGDILYYVIKIGEIPVAMGQQSIKIELPIQLDRLQNIEDPSFIRFGE